MDLQLINLNNFSIDLKDNSYFVLTNISGQTAVAANLSSIVIGSIDGDDVNNVQAQPRTIILDLRIKNGVDVEDAKREILRVIKLKQSVKLKWTQNLKILTLDGIVESIDMPRWSNQVMMQVTLHCEQPFWEDFDSIIVQINEAIALHYFTTYPNDQLIFTAGGQPFGEIDLSRTRSFYNNGDTAVGMYIEIIALSTVTNPIMTDANGKFFGIGHGTGNKQVVMSAGDIIRISTHKGKKSVTLNNTSVMSKIKPQSTWLQLEAGYNTLAINSDDVSTDNVTFNLEYKQRYV